MRKASRFVCGTARAPALAAAPVAQKRHTEYWGMHVSARTQPYAQGDMMPETVNMHMVNQSNRDAVYLCGNGSLVAYDNETIADREAQGHLVRDKVKLFNGIDKYVIDPITEADAAVVAGLWESLSADKAEAWDKVFKLYPQLKKPLDEAGIAELNAFYSAALPVAHDDEAVHALASPLMLKMLNERVITRTYWFRFCEAITEAIVEQPGVRGHPERITKVVLERVTKLMHNTINDYPWASHDLTSPNEFDMCGTRIYHEAGMW